MLSNRITTMELIFGLFVFVSTLILLGMIDGIFPMLSDIAIFTIAGFLGLVAILAMRVQKK